MEDAGDIVQLQDAQSPLHISLDPYEVITLEATPNAPESWLANSTYREWSLRRTSGQTAPLSAFGKTGIANLMAFALGIDPHDLNTNVSARYSLVPEGNGTTFQYIRAADLGMTSLDAEVSEDLHDWNSGPGHVEVLSEAPLPDGTVLVTVQADSSYSASHTLFYRLRASHSP